MNVFPEEPSMITLTACSGSQDCAIIAILLEVLRVPYTLELIKNPTQPNTHTHPHPPLLADTIATGVTTTDDEVIQAAFYLLRHYDPDRSLFSSRRRPEEGARICECIYWFEQLRDEGLQERLKRQNRNQNQQQEKEQSESKRKTRTQIQTQTASAAPPYDHTPMSHEAVVRNRLHLYLLLEKKLHDRKGGGYLVSDRCTLADYVLFPVVAAAGSVGLDLE